MGKINYTTLQKTIEPEVFKYVFMMDTFTIMADMILKKDLKMKVCLNMKDTWAAMTDNQRAVVKGFFKEIERLSFEAALKQYENDNTVSISIEDISDDIINPK